MANGVWSSQTLGRNLFSPSTQMQTRDEVAGDPRLPLVPGPGEEEKLGSVCRPLTACLRGIHDKAGLFSTSSGRLS